MYTVVTRKTIVKSDKEGEEQREKKREKKKKEWVEDE